MMQQTKKKQQKTDKLKVTLKGAIHIAIIQYSNSYETIQNISCCLYLLSEIYNFPPLKL